MCSSAHLIKLSFGRLFWHILWECEGTFPYSVLYSPRSESSSVLKKPPGPHPQASWTNIPALPIVTLSLTWVVTLKDFPSGELEITSNDDTCGGIVSWLSSFVITHVLTCPLAMVPEQSSDKLEM